MPSEPKQFYELNADGEFVPAGYEFTGWPANGIWIVEQAKQNCIYQFQGDPIQPTPTLVSYMRYKDELMHAINHEWKNRALGARDIAEIACEFFAIKAGGMKIGDELLEN